VDVKVCKCVKEYSALHQQISPALPKVNNGQ
jgi:hypothetical protein